MKPHVSTELLEYLKATFPDSCPDKTDLDRDIWMSVGAVAVVRHLEALERAQVAEALGRKTTVKG